MTTDIQNLKTFDPFAEADDEGETKQSQNYIHLRIQRMFIFVPLSILEIQLRSLI